MVTSIFQKVLLSGAGTLAGLFALSFVHPFGDARQAGARPQQILAGASAPETIRELIQHKCGNCHSESVEWPVYARVAPISWLLEHDVTEAREHMNLSRWDAYGDERRVDLLTKLGAEVRNGQMPPRRYTLLHPDAKLTQAEQDAIYAWTRTERKRMKLTASTRARF